jgi:hypothetical protein
VPQAVVVPPRPVVVAVQTPERGTGGVVLRAELLDPRSGRLADGATGSLTFSLDDEVLGSAPLRYGEAELHLAGLAEGRVGARFHGDAEHAAGDGVAPEGAGTR